MKVSSPAGDFEILIKDSSVEGDYVVLKGQMGVWDSKIYMSASDIWLSTTMFLRPSVLLFLIRLPFKLLLGHDVKKKQENDE